MPVKPDVPIVLFTGYIADLSAESARAIGFYELVNKPVTPAAVAEVLHRALSGASRKGRGLSIAKDLSP